MGGPSEEEEILVAEQAAGWLRRMRQDPNRATQAEFIRWLKSSPLHVREMLVAEVVDRELDNIDPQRKIDIDALIRESAGNVVRTGFGGRATAQDRSRRGAWPAVAGVATFASVALATAWLAGPLALQLPGRFETSIGEQRTIPLADGSLAHLNTQSSIRVRMTAEEREVDLRDGQVTFKVKEDPARVFRVYIDGAVIEARGTEFDVYKRNDRTDVAVLDGRVRVAMLRGEEAGDVPSSDDALRQVVLLRARQGARITSDGIAAPEDVNVEAVRAWRNRMLLCNDKRLDEIAAEYNRYNRTPQIVVEGDDVRAKRYSGAYYVDEPQILIDVVAGDREIEIERSADFVILRPSTRER